MAARDSRKDCWLGSPLSLRERGLGVRVQSLLNPEAEVKDILTLTPALSRSERVVYTSGGRLTLLIQRESCPSVFTGMCTRWSRRSWPVTQRASG